jgi:hypothetical protein
MFKDHSGRIAGIVEIPAILGPIVVFLATTFASGQGLPPNPVVTSISPAAVTQGNPGFKITVMGRDFVLGSSVAVDSYPVPTSFVSSNQLIASVPSSFLTVPTQTDISVRNPGDLGSNQVFLTVRPSPQIVSATPQDVIAGSPGFTLTIVGSQFVPGSTVQVGGSSLTTSYISANELTAFVPASLLTTSARLNVAVAASRWPGFQSRGVDCAADPHILGKRAGDWKSSDH